MREFDRVVAHVSGSRGMLAAVRIAHLLSCWPCEGDIVENLRLDQQTHEYLSLRAQGNMESRWAILLARLNTYRVEPTVPTSFP